MKFTCEKSLLQEALTVVSRAVSPKSSIPALEGILIEAGESLRLTGYNLETGIRSVVSSEITEEGTLVISSRLFCDLVRKLPDDIVVFSSENNMVNIKCGMSEFNLMATDPEEFPDLPTVEYQNTVDLEQRNLKSMISQTLFAVSDNESRPIHTGSLFEVDDLGLTVVSVDGYRLALRHEKITSKTGDEKFSFVVPGASLNEVEKICADTDESVEIVLGERHIMFKTGNTILVSRRLEGEFLSYKNAIPQNNNYKIEVDKRTLISSIERVSLIISDKLKSPLRCMFENNRMKISTKTAIGDAQDVCDVNGNGNGLEIGFNNKYLLDALKAAPAQSVRMEMSSGVAPCVIKPADDSGKFIYMVLPVRLKAVD